MAHNGGFEDLARLEAELGTACAALEGDTDSERFFSLVTQRIERHDGDVGAGIIEAAQWIADHLPLFSLNLVLIAGDELWALRYPDHHNLYVLNRAAGGHRGGDPLRTRSATLEVSSDHLGEHPSVVVASEPMDDSHDWRLMEPGELVHVARDLTLTSTLALPDPPCQRSIDPLPYAP
jgi:glutamine amidotransferase